MITSQTIKKNLNFTTFSADRKMRKLTAMEQRSLFFGFAPFGRKSIKMTEWGVDTMIKVAFGMDFDEQSYTWDEIAQMINNKKKAWK